MNNRNFRKVEEGGCSLEELESRLNDLEDAADKALAELLSRPDLPHFHPFLMELEDKYYMISQKAIDAYRELKRLKENHKEECSHV